VKHDLAVDIYAYIKSRQLYHYCTAIPQKYLSVLIGRKIMTLIDGDSSIKAIDTDGEYRQPTKFPTLVSPDHIFSKTTFSSRSNY